MTRPRSVTALHAACGVALLGAVAIHAHHLLTGYQAFWVSVTVLMTVFCVCSSILLMGARATAAFVIFGVVLGFFFEALSIRTGFPFGPYYWVNDDELVSDTRGTDIFDKKTSVKASGGKN